jgi:hypothetical protein
LNNKVTLEFRILFLIGCAVLVCSLFLDWYSFQIFNLDNELICLWDYYIFFGWKTPILEDSTFNTMMRPETALIPLGLNVILIIIMLLSGYIILFKDVEKSTNIRKYYKFGYILAFLVILVFFYVIICPFLYLISYGLYFPLYKIIDVEQGFVFFYTVKLGYFLQLTSFPLLFPYCIFYFSTINNFIQQEKSPDNKVNEIIRQCREEIDLDKMIAEEELKHQLRVIKK